MSVALVDQGPMARLEGVRADEGTPSVVFARLTEGETLREIAKAWQVPVGKFTEWFMNEHSALYDAALKVRADELVHGALDDAGDATPESVAVAKLQVDTKLKVASKWDRKRYGEESDTRAGSPVTIQIANLRGAPIAITAGAAAAVEVKTEEAPI